MLSSDYQSHRDAPTPFGDVRNSVCGWRARRPVGFPERLEAGSILPCLHLVERPDILRPVYHFVKPQTTIYCAFLLGHAQYVDSILARATSDFAQATGLIWLELAAAELAGT